MVDRQVVVTSTQADAARMIVKRDSANGKPTPAPIQAIANARVTVSQAPLSSPDAPPAGNHSASFGPDRHLAKPGSIGPGPARDATRVSKGLLRKLMGAVFVALKRPESQ